MSVPVKLVKVGSGGPLRAVGQSIFLFTSELGQSGQGLLQLLTREAGSVLGNWQTAALLKALLCSLSGDHTACC